jgi:hypothetical protein
MLAAAASRVFLLSPAHGGGKRAALLLSDRARFPLALRLRAGERVALGEAFGFLSGLYFRGKLPYGSEFARPPAGEPGVQVITTSRGLLAPGEPRRPQWLLINHRDEYAEPGSEIAAGRRRASSSK